MSSASPPILDRGRYLAFFDEMMTSTESLFRMVPPDTLAWKPTEKSFTVGQMIAHIAEALDVYSNGLTKAAWGFSSMRERFVKNRHQMSLTVEEALALLRTNAGEFRKRIESMSATDLAEGEVFSPQYDGPAPRWRIAMLALEHHLNHKAELFMYLKLLGVQVNTKHLYRG